MFRYSRGVMSPGRHVRTRLYFTSESHVHSLLSVFRYGGLLDVRCGSNTHSAVICRHRILPAPFGSARSSSSLSLWLVSGGEGLAVEAGHRLPECGDGAQLHDADRHHAVRGQREGGGARAPQSCGSSRRRSSVRLTSLCCVQEPTSEERFHVELHFSPGVKGCEDEENVPLGFGFRPASSEV